MLNRNTLFGGASLLLAWVIFLIWLWRPEHQVRLHQRHLFAALEDRNWDRIRSLMSDNYSDRWRHDKEFVLREAREVFRQFIVLQVTGEILEVMMEEGAGDVSSTLEMKGKGGPVAEFAMSRVNALRRPWAFRWEKQSWKPWDWVLVRVDHPDLDITPP
jgi:hypothetical protein